MVINSDRKLYAYTVLSIGRIDQVDYGSFLRRNCQEKRFILAVSTTWLKYVDTANCSLMKEMPDEEEDDMKIGYLFPVAIIVAGVALLAWFIASGAYAPGG
jgi:hypothetical protein